MILLLALPIIAFTELLCVLCWENRIEDTFVNLDEKGMDKRKIRSWFLGIAMCVFFIHPVDASNVHDLGLGKTLSIAQVKLDKNGDFIPEMLGDTVTIAGRATVSSGVLMKNHLLISIQDSTGGVMVFRRNYRGPAIKAGDSLRITGMVGQYYGHVEINSSQIDFVDTLNRRIPRPIQMSSKSPRKLYDGKLVEMDAIIIDKSGNSSGKYLVVSKANGSDSTVTVFVQNQAKNPRLLNHFSVGEVVKITGLFMRYDLSNTNDGEYQIVPRSENDLVLLKYNASHYLTILSIVLGAVLLSVLLNFLLRRQVISRTRQLQRAKEKAEESDRLKTAFLANMSHEIRTPMNGILGFTDLLRNSTLSNQERDGYIEIIHQSGQRMLSTVNDIIEISKIETGLVTHNPVKFDINKTLKDLMSFFKPEAAKKEINLYVEKWVAENMATIVTDKFKFESIVSNLIKNAIKYTSDGEIKIGFYLKNKQVEFYISDTGMGISEERQKAIFDRFVQADIEDKRALGGSGLGLSIAKAYAEAIGGDLWLERSVPGSGSEFRFRLPSDVSPDSKRHKSDKNHEKVNGFPKNLTVLVVEDDEVSYQYLAKLLTNMTKEILWAKDGAEAVQMFKNKTHIDLVLMDMLLSGINGFEATRRIREINEDVIIIAQTALALAGEKEKILASGFNDYLSKPFLLHDFKKVISKYF